MHGQQQDNDFLERKGPRRTMKVGLDSQQPQRQSDCLISSVPKLCCILNCDYHRTRIALPQKHIHTIISEGTTTFVPLSFFCDIEHILIFPAYPICCDRRQSLLGYGVSYDQICYSKEYHFGLWGVSTLGGSGRLDEGSIVRGGRLIVVAVLRTFDETTAKSRLTEGALVAGG